MDVYVVTTTQKWIGKTLYDDGHRIMGIFNAHETAKLFIDLLVKDNEKDYADGIGGYGVVEERPIELSEQINLVGSEECVRNMIIKDHYTKGYCHCKYFIRRENIRMSVEDK